MFKTTCFDIWRNEEDSRKIITLCKELDRHLGGGLAPGIVTELCGAPGSGKTQMCLQLCISVQFPEQVGGVGGKALYIDTNQGFHPHRLKEIACCMQQHFQQTFSQQSCADAVADFSVENLMRNVWYIYCNHYMQLVALVSNLRNVLKEHSQLKLIVIDSFSFLVRRIENVTLRTRIDYEILTDLQSIAMEFNVIVVITNELTTRCIGNNWQICPSLGGSHMHKVNQRLVFSKERNSNCHVVMVDKSVLSPKVAIRFEIKPGGIHEIRL